MEIVALALFDSEGVSVGRPASEAWMVELGEWSWVPAPDR